MNKSRLALFTHFNGYDDMLGVYFFQGSYVFLGCFGKLINEEPILLVNNYTLLYKTYTFNGDLYNFTVNLYV